MIYYIKRDFGCEGYSCIEVLKTEKPQNMEELQTEYFSYGMGDIQGKYARYEEIARFIIWLKDKKGFVKATDQDFEDVVFED